MVMRVLPLLFVAAITAGALAASDSAPAYRGSFEDHGIAGLPPGIRIRSYEHNCPPHATPTVDPNTCVREGRDTSCKIYCKYPEARIARPTPSPVCPAGTVRSLDYSSCRYVNGETVCNTFCKPFHQPRPTERAPIIAASVPSSSQAPRWSPETLLIAGGIALAILVVATLIHIANVSSSRSSMDDIERQTRSARDLRRRLEEAADEADEFLERAMHDSRDRGRR